MPRAIRYRCETIPDPAHPERLVGMTWAQTAGAAARTWDAALTEGHLYVVQPMGGGLRTHWEVKGGVRLRVSNVALRKRQRAERA